MLRADAHELQAVDLAGVSGSWFPRTAYHTAAAKNSKRQLPGPAITIGNA